jgi:hypothetical protein
LLVVVAVIFFVFSVNKEDRSSFIRDNDADAEKHHEHFLRTASRSRPNSDIMPGLNKVRTQTATAEGLAGGFGGGEMG